MTTSTTPFGPEFITKIIDETEKNIASSTAQFANAAWSALLLFLAAHWIAATLLLFTIFVFVTIKAGFGQWGSLGSFLYNLLYFGILFIVGLIWGPGVFLGDLFKLACTIALNPICYFLVGRILDKMGVHH